MLRYKACRNSIIILELLNDTITNEKRKDVINDKYAKFRCDKAKVIDITNVKTGELMEGDVSIYDSEFVYSFGEIIETVFDENLDEVCTNGIHYFKTKEAALSWFYNQDDKNFPDGKWIRWNENGEKHCEGTYKNGKHDGKWTGWHENGQKFYECAYKNGKHDGKCIYWYGNEKNQKESEVTRKDGILEGKCTCWWYNADKRSEGSYKDGKKEGKWTEWWVNGQIKSEETYKDGLVVCT